MNNPKLFHRIIIVLLLTISNQMVYSQSTDEQAPALVIVEQMPEYPGGNDALYIFLSSNIQYPAIAKEKGISGTVFISFIVEQDGSVTNAKILKGIGGGCDEEALRVVNSMPHWNPGKQQGKNVRVQFNLPIRFSLS